MNLKDIFSRLEPRGVVDLRSLYFSSTYSFEAVDRYFDRVTGHAYDVTKAVGGKRMWRRTTTPIHGIFGVGSFEGSRWEEEGV